MCSERDRPIAKAVSRRTALIARNVTRLLLWRSIFIVQRVTKTTTPLVLARSYGRNCVSAATRT